MATGELIVAPRGDVVVANDFMPLLSVDEAVKRKAMINEFISKVLREDDGTGRGDYGVIPGTKKPTLLKPGAEKLCSMFGLTPQYTADSIIEDWTGENHGGEPMFYYAYRCSLSRGGRFMGEAIGSCSSWESKYRHRWVREDQLPQGVDKATVPSKGGKQTLFAYDFAIEKAETPEQSAFGKPAEYWETFRRAIADGSAKEVSKIFKKTGKPGKGYEITVDTTLYRLPNPDVADSVNTIQKMAQKRALLAAVLIVTNASDAFTQDMEDSGIEMESPLIPRRGGSGPISSGGELFDDDNEATRGSPQPSPTPPPPSRSPQQSQQAASQAQFEQRQQSANPAERPIPEELADVFSGIDKRDGKAVQRAFKHMDERFKDLGHSGADKEYEDIKVAYREKFPSDGAKKGGPLDVKTLLLDMWDCLKRWEGTNGSV